MYTSVIIEVIAEIVKVLLVTLIGVAGAWLTKKIGDNEQLKTIAAAQEELTKQAQTTVEELQQTFVVDAKAAAADGKLTEEEIANLGEDLVQGTIEKMSDKALKVLGAAGTDVEGMIKSVGEAWILKIKEG